MGKYEMYLDSNILDGFIVVDINERRISVDCGIVMNFITYNFFWHEISEIAAYVWPIITSD